MTGNTVMNQNDTAGHVYYRPRIDASTDDSLGKIARRITEGSTVLDIGCGVGALGQYLTSCKQCRCDGVESNQEAAAQARPFYARLIEADIEKDDFAAKVGQNRYDWIVLADVLEHLHEPAKTLTSCKALLNEQGKILISLPNIGYVGVLLELLDGEFHYRSDGLLDTTHLRFFTRKAFLRLLAETGWAGEVVDHVYQHIDDTEFRDVQRGALGDQVKTALQSDSDSMTYQFIIEAVPAEKRHLLSSAAPLDEIEVSGPWFYPVLYWRNDQQNFDENRSAKIPLLVGLERQVARFTFPTGIHALRLDPAERPGFIHLYSLKLYHNNEVVWIWDGSVRSILLAEHDGMVLSQNRAEDGSVVFLLTNDDPRFEIPIDAETLNLCDALEVELSWPKSFDYHILQDEINKLEAELNLRLQQVDTLRSQAVNWERQMAENDLQWKICVNNLEHTISENEILWENQKTNLQNALSEKDQQLASVHAHLTGLLSSRSWKVTKPLRGFAWVIRKIRLFLRSSKAIIQYKRWPNPVEISLSFNHKVGTLGETSVGTNESAIGATEEECQIPRIAFSDTSDAYVDYHENPAVQSVVKIIAFYLPQFHPFPENDAWWGKGFTEWTNVNRAVPFFENHDQPRRPIHLGYYDLRIPSIMEEQARLAQQYGIYGFSYYFYWFGGRRLMEGPLEMMLTNKEVSIPFCLTWANENWTRRWDGLESELLIAQEHSDQDSLELIRYLMKYFKDERYIRIEDKPVLIVYRADIIPNIKKISRIWREEMLRQGYHGLYLVAAQTFGIGDATAYGFDAAVEFPPHAVNSSDIRHEVLNIDESFIGNIYSYEQVVKNAVQRKEPHYKLFRTAMLRWDNSARRGIRGHIFHSFSTLLYKQWVSALVSKVYLNQKYSNDEKLVFVNAWNEWAEGSYLEPDARYGFAHLQTTYDVIKSYDRLEPPKPLTRTYDHAIIIHIHYAEVWDDIKQRLDDILSTCNLDIIVTTSLRDIKEQVQKDLPSAQVLLVDNRGRDVLPFIIVLREIISLGYLSALKIHTKRSLYRDDGDKIRTELLDNLIGSANQVSNAMSCFSNAANLGLLIPDRYLVQHNDHNMTFDKEIVGKLCDMLDMQFSFGEFPAGSMFWFRPAALSPLLKLDDSDFPPEEGLADGTIAHAVERMFCLIAIQKGFAVQRQTKG